VTTDIEQFQFPVTGQAVRTVEVKGEPYFVAADVTAILGYTNGRAAVAQHVDEEDRNTVAIRDGMRGNPNAAVVNESGLYALIFGSKLEAAKAFKRWVTAEVLPTLHRTGAYTLAHRLPTSFAEALELAAKQARELEAAEAHIAEIAPAADHWHVLAAADGDYSVADAAKILSRDPQIKIGRDRLFRVLDEANWVYRQQADGKWRTYQSAVDAGRLSEIPQSHYHPRTGELVLDPPQVRVTPKGIADLRVLLGGTVPLAIASSEGK
jgi:anti-repressor protein